MISTEMETHRLERQLLILTYVCDKTAGNMEIFPVHHQNSCCLVQKHDLGMVYWFYKEHSGL